MASDRRRLRAAPGELRLLADACREADLIDSMTELLGTGSLLTAGSMGQDRPHPLLTEIRGHRALLATLLKQLALPDDAVCGLLCGRLRRRRGHRRLHVPVGTVVAVALRRQPVEPRTAVTSALSAAEVQRLRTLAELFEVGGLGEHTAPYAVVVEVAEVAGGPVEDFTGPMGRPMPLELWSDALLSEVPYSALLADRLVAAVESYRASLPRYWRNLHPSHHPNPSTDPERKAPS